jgi:hypothetical protein
MGGDIVASVTRDCSKVAVRTAGFIVIELVADNELDNDDSEWNRDPETPLGTLWRPSVAGIEWI